MAEPAPSSGEANEIHVYIPDPCAGVIASASSYSSRIQLILDFESYYLRDFDAQNTDLARLPEGYLRILQARERLPTPKSTVPAAS